MTEYGIIVQTVEIKPDMQDATADEISQSMVVGLNQILQKASKGLSNLPNGKKGEIVSHSLTRIGRHLVLSILFRNQ
jgi:hypothetical protein